mmetsp:Transcript_19572/g.46934  ORF Transcript_19572/g.46934 Transcript_19572/m.46934 type:complete len:147 (+) Transcript_19572:307-747(+)
MDCHSLLELMGCACRPRRKTMYYFPNSLGPCQERDHRLVGANVRSPICSTTISSPESPESEDMDEDDSALSLFNFGVLKRLWTAGEQKEVGRREVAFLAIGEGRTCEFPFLHVRVREDQSLRIRVDNPRHPAIQSQDKLCLVHSII